MKNDGFFHILRASIMNYADLSTKVMIVGKLYMSIFKDIKVLYNLAKFH